jgi:hypothetical protein
MMGSIPRAVSVPKLRRVIGDKQKVSRPYSGAEDSAPSLTGLGMTIGRGLLMDGPFEVSPLKIKSYAPESRPL